MIKQIFLLMLGISTLSSCIKNEDIILTDNIPTSPSTSSKNRILPLGASRVEGDRPNFESFRYELWKDLVDGNWAFDLIGTVNDEALYPEYDGKAFDADHEGRGGWTTGDILNEINNSLKIIGAPDIVLFSSPAGNDALYGLSYTNAISNVNAIIDAIQSVNPNVTIIIEQLAPARSDEMTPELTNYLSRIHQDVVSISNSQTTSSSQVLPVDMYSGFTDEYLADAVHYNESGASFIADRYYEVLTKFLKQ